MLTLVQKVIAVGTVLFLVGISSLMVPVFGVIALVLGIPMILLVVQL